MKKNFLIFGNPDIKNNDIREVLDTLKSGWLGTAPKVNQFEKNICKYKKAKYSIALNSCTAALHLSLLAIKLKKGDEVILPSMTFAASIEMFSNAR